MSDVIMFNSPFTISHSPFILHTPPVNHHESIPIVLRKQGYYWRKPCLLLQFPIQLARVPDRQTNYLVKTAVKAMLVEQAFNLDWHTLTPKKILEATWYRLKFQRSLRYKVDVLLKMLVRPQDWDDVPLPRLFFRSIIRWTPFCFLNDVFHEVDGFDLFFQASDFTPAIVGVRHSIYFFKVNTWQHIRWNIFLAMTKK